MKLKHYPAVKITKRNMNRVFKFLGTEKTVQLTQNFLKARFKTIFLK